MDSSFGYTHWQYPISLLRFDNENKKEQEEQAQQARRAEQSEQEAANAYFELKLDEYIEERERKKKAEWHTHPMLEDGDYEEKYEEEDKAGGTELLQAIKTSKKRKRGAIDRIRHHQEEIPNSQQVR